MADRDLLIEIGTEELPPKALHGLAEAFRTGVLAGLDRAELTHGEVREFATPRRLAVLVRQVADRQADKAVERRGPALRAAYDAEGRPTQAALGFAAFGCLYTRTGREPDTCRRKKNITFHENPGQRPAPLTGQYV